VDARIHDEAGARRFDVLDHDPEKPVADLTPGLQGVQNAAGVLVDGNSETVPLADASGGFNRGDDPDDLSVDVE
jgi:hypothetical protein